MLSASDDERLHVETYFKSQAPDLAITFMQKVYQEAVLSHVHAIWDIHTDKDRWWVITNPTNLYAQDQFPNMDLALTFHVGLCLRIPRQDKPDLVELEAEPFTQTFRLLIETDDALRRAEEIADFQAVGVRCRETLLAFIAMARTLVPWDTKDGVEPKAAGAKEWIQHLASKLLPGDTNERRRQLYRGLLDGAWNFANWLTHAKSSNWYDAEAAFSSTDNAVGLFVALLLRHIKGVPDNCPECGSRRLTKQRATNPQVPDLIVERTVCTKCEWAGAPIAIGELPDRDQETSPPEGECVIPSTQLRAIRQPTD